MFTEIHTDKEKLTALSNPILRLRHNLANKYDLKNAFLYKTLQG